MHTGWRQGAQTLAKSVWNSPSVPVWRTSPPFALLTLMILIPHANTIHLLQLNNSGFSLTLRLWEQKYGGRPGNYKFLPYFVCPNLSELHCLLWNWGEEVKHCRRMVHWLKKFLSPNNTFKKLMAMLSMWGIFIHDSLITGSVIGGSLWCWLNVCMCVYVCIHNCNPTGVIISHYPWSPGYSCVVWCGTILSHILPRGRWSKGSHSIYELPCLLSSVLKHNTFITAKMWLLNQHDGTQIPLSLFECCHVVCHIECIICIIAIMSILYSCVLHTLFHKYIHSQAEQTE